MSETMLEPIARIATYIRVSTGRQAAEGFSLEAQTERLEAFVKYHPNWQIVRRYADKGFTGTKTEIRKEYNQMMIEKDAWDCILVVKLDRIHRNNKNFGQMMDYLKSWGKQFISISEQLDTTTTMGAFVMEILSLLAQLESKQISDRVVSGMDVKARTTDGHLGKRCPYGYTFIPPEKIGEEGVYIINEVEATVIKRVFDLYLNGTSMREIADTLKSEGVKTKRGGVWEAATVQVILSNPFYAAWDCWDGILRRSSQPAIISIETFNRVQRRIAEKRRKTDKKPNLIIEGMN